MQVAQVGIALARLIIRAIAREFHASANVDASNSLISSTAVSSVDNVVINRTVVAIIVVATILITYGGAFVFFVSLLSKLLFSIFH